jgi:DNA modification methylase
MTLEPFYQRAGITLYLGDNRDILPQLEPESISAVITDPPYGLSKEPDMAEVLSHWLAGDDYTHTGGGFMGKSWDSFVPGPATWRAIEATMKPGAHLLSFAGTRTSDLMGIAIRLAGLERRDTLCWLQGAGFPKSLSVSKAIDKRGGANIAWFGPWLREERKRRGISSNQLAQYFPSKTGGETGCVRNWELGFNLPTPKQFNTLCKVMDLPFSNIAEAERKVIGKVNWSNSANHFEPGKDHTQRVHLDITAPATPEAQQWEGWHTALKPSFEPILLCRKPLAKGHTVAAQVLATGTGAINVDASRVGYQSDGDKRRSGRHGEYGQTSPGGIGFNITKMHAEQNTAGRWPPNVLLDEAAARDLDAMSGVTKSPRDYKRTVHGEIGYHGKAYGQDAGNGYGDSGGASRYFPILPIDDPETLRFLYTPKSSRRERNAGLEGMPERIASVGNLEAAGRDATNPSNYYGTGQQNRVEQGLPPSEPRANHHPTVKPLALCLWLLTLVAPPGGIVLDPFVGSGSTLVAAAQLGISAVGIEMDESYAEIAARRIDHVLSATRQHALNLPD